MKEKKRERERNIFRPPSKQETPLNDSYHTQTQIDTHTHKRPPWLPVWLHMREWREGGGVGNRKKKKERSRCRVFRREKQRDTVDMNCCYYRPVQANTKDRVAAADVKEVQTEGEREHVRRGKRNEK